MRTVVWRWWNKRYGRLGRRDVVIWTDDTGTRWAVEDRRGGADGRSRWCKVASEREALTEAQRCRGAEGDGWLDISPKPKEQGHM